MRTLPQAKSIRRSDLDGALFLLKQPGDDNGINNDDSQMETTTDFQLMLRTATKQEQQRQKLLVKEQQRRNRTMLEAYLVEHLEQFVPSMPQKAKKCIARERREAGGNLHHHWYPQPNDTTYWQEHYGFGSKLATYSSTAVFQLG